MNYLFNLLVCLAVIVLQTAILPLIPLLDRFYDLILPFILFLSLYRPVSESVVSLVAAGYLMDAMSGGPLGLYVSAYLWIYLALIWLVRYLHLYDSILLPVVVAGIAVMQHLIFLAASSLGSRPIELDGAVLKTIALQSGLALVTGPFILFFYRTVYGAWKRGSARWRIRRDGAQVG